MKDLMVFIGVIIADLILLIEIIYFVIRKSVTNKLIEAAFENNKDKFNKVSNSVLGKIISKFDKEFIKFNVAQIKKDNVAIESSIKYIETLDLSKAQKKKIYPKIFYHYIDTNNKESAKEYYQLLNELSVYKNKNDIERVYDTFVLNGYKYLNEALKDLKKANKENMPSLEKMIGRMYENKGIRQDAKKYYRLAERDQLELERKRK